MTQALDPRAAGPRLQYFARTAITTCAENEGVPAADVAMAMFVEALAVLVEAHGPSMAISLCDLASWDLRQAEKLAAGNHAGTA